MPEVAASGTRLAYDIEGPSTGRAVLFVHALGTSGQLWNPQVAALAHAYRTIRYDVRGHGRSTTSEMPVTLDTLGADALAVLDAAGVARADVCGLSLGGIVGLWLALHVPNRVRRLVLANTAAKLADDTFWQARIDMIRQSGLGVVAEQSPSRWFTGAFIERAPETVASFQHQVRSASPQGYIQCCEVLRQTDLRSRLEEVAARTLVVTGRHDAVTPPSAADVLASTIPGASLVTLDAAHFSNVECADAFNAALITFLSSEGYDVGRS